MDIKGSNFSSGLCVYAGGEPFVECNSLLGGMSVYAGGKDMTPAEIYHVSQSATWTVLVKGISGSKLDFNPGDGGDTESITLLGDTTTVPWIHDFSSGYGLGIVQIRGDVDSIYYLDMQSCGITYMRNLFKFTRLHVFSRIL